MSKLPYQSKCKAILKSVTFEEREYKGEVKPQLVGTFEIIDGEDRSRTETWFASLSEERASTGKRFVDYTIEALRACGWKGDDLTELPALAEAGKLSNEVQIVREHRTGQDGRWRSKVKYVNGPRRLTSSGSPGSMNKSALSELSKRLKAKPAEATAVDEDKLPF